MSGRPKHLVVKIQGRVYSVGAKSLREWLRNKRQGEFPGKELGKIEYDLSELNEENLPQLLEKIWKEEHK